jgi:two-component system, sensor histidine kinase and response regulator
MHQERTEFFGIVVHDLKTPLNTVTLLARSLEDLGDVMSNADKLDSLHSMRITADHMRASISKLLEMNNLENKVLSLNLVPVSLLPILNLLIERLSVNARKKTIALHTELPRTLPAIRADEQALYNVLENLLSNAIKFSPHNETVIIRIKQFVASDTISKDREARNSASIAGILNLIPTVRHALFTAPAQSTFTETHRARSKQMIRIEIEDHGKGIPMNEQAGLFQKFSRLSTKPTDDEHSSGLGLFIVRKYMDAMHGTVQCESTPGVKTIFAIEIPIHIEISSSSRAVS